MRNWLPRGLVFAALMVIVRLIQGVLINAWEAQAGLISSTLVLLFVIAVVVWGFIDGRADATATPDPDRRKDLAMTWLGAGLLAGVLSGVVAWLISLFDHDLYVGGLINEVSTFAAFTALLVFVPAVAAVALGRRVVDKGYAKLPQRHHGLAAHDGDHAPADVFAAVGAGAQQAAAANAAADTAVLPVIGGAAPGFTVEDFPTEAVEPAETAAEAAETAAAVAPESPEETTAVIPAVDDKPDETS